MEDRFEIRDKRRFDVEGNVKREEAERPAAPEPRPEHAGERPEADRPGAQESDLFVSFLLNLSAMAYMAMGMGEVAAQPNLAEAKYMIDVLGELEKKTKGNLSVSEEKALRQILYELRINFAKVAERSRA